MSWNNVAIQPRVSRSFFTTPVGAPSNPSSSVHAPNLPATRGPVPQDRINTNGVIEDPEFTLWGRWHKGGLNTMKVDGDTVIKESGYGWRAAIGKTGVDRGIRRAEIEVVSKTGLLQVGVIGEVYIDVWNHEEASDVWYMMSNGDLYHGSSCVAKSRKPIKVGDIIGLEMDMNYGRTVFRKLAASARGRHVFGAPCKACWPCPPEGLPQCRLWNSAEGPDGLVGELADIMTYRARLSIGNLPPGKQQRKTGTWIHPCGRPMSEVVSEFFSLFGEVLRVVSIQRQHRSAVVELRDPYALQHNGEVEIDAMRLVLQGLSGVQDQTSLREMVTPQGQRVPLEDWIALHSPSDPRIATFLGEGGLLAQRRKSTRSLTRSGFHSAQTSTAPTPNAATSSPTNRHAPALVPYRGRPRPNSSPPRHSFPSSPASPLGRTLAWGQRSPSPRVGSSPRSPLRAQSPPSLFRFTSDTSTMSGFSQASAETSEAGVSVAGVFIAPVSGRGKVPCTLPTRAGLIYPSAALSKKGSAVLLRQVNDEVEAARIARARAAQLRHFGVAPSPWGRAEDGMVLQEGGRVMRLNRAGVGGRGAMFSTALSLTWMARVYSPTAKAIVEDEVEKSGRDEDGRHCDEDSDGDERRESETTKKDSPSLPHTRESRAEGSHLPKDGWLPHPDGWRGRRKWEVDDEVSINKRRWNFEIVQAGLHGEVYSAGLCVGVIAVNPRKPVQLDRSWRSSLFNGIAFYVDGSRGVDRNSIPTGGCLYDGEQVIFKQQVTRLRGFLQGDQVGVEVDMGRQLRDEDGNLTPETLMGAFHPTTVRFFHNGRLIPGELTEPVCLVGHTGLDEPGPLAVHPAVCLQNEGDCVALSEVHWSVWPCPHDSHQECSECTQRKAELAREEEEEGKGRIAGPVREEVKMEGGREHEIKMDGEERGEVGGPPARGDVGQAEQREEIQGVQRGEISGPDRRA